jgi:hypothetical protein
MEISPWKRGGSGREAWGNPAALLGERRAGTPAAAREPDAEVPSPILTVEPERSAFGFMHIQRS